MLKNSWLLSGALSIALFTPNAWSWNQLGHQLVAQIAYNHLSPHTKRIYNKYNHAIDYRSFVNAAPWLDTIRNPDDLAMHYIDIPFSPDKSAFSKPDKINAVSAIEKANKVLADRYSSLYEKGYALRILLHVVGDVHQPMHAVSMYSKRFPNGDKGGNLQRFKKNPIASNLHSWWDRGGGLLKAKNKYSNAQINRRARAIERRHPCDTVSISNDPQVWANESHEIAINQAYQVGLHEKPSKPYQSMTKAVSEERIALAGCRLAALLNKLAE